jgi:hypothetical protein
VSQETGHVAQPCHFLLGLNPRRGETTDPAHIFQYTPNFTFFINEMTEKTTQVRKDAADFPSASPK